MNTSRYASIGVGIFAALGGLVSPVQAAEPTVTDSVGLQFVLIPSGTFLMGAVAGDDKARPSEKPQHQVTISKPFYLGKHEVTIAQWKAVMGSDPYSVSRSNPFYELPGMAARVNRPGNPVTVSWNDAQEFIKRLNQKEGHARYRLPTEAEWEYAARAGTTSTYSFGDDERQLKRFAWYGEDFASGSTHPVGQKEPNKWGLHDIHGNVWEWVQDWYSESYYANSPNTNPQGPSTGTERVVRGGSWHQTSTSWRSSFRKPYAPNYRGISIGFRLALEP